MGIDAETAAPPPGAATDWSIPQNWSAYTPEQHALWDQLYTRQVGMLPSRVTPAFMKGLETLRLSRSGIPDFEELSERLQKLTGWSVVAVPGLVPDEIFFDHLANRRFVAGNFIRTPEQMDYLQEPDVFHDVFGHVPLLTDPVFADYMQAYGQGGLKAMKHDAIHQLSRLYWYTVEFGLIRENDDLKLYGAGIVSSHSESVFALDDASPHRIGFNMKRVMQTRYRIDDFQETYFVINSFDDLLKQTLETDFAPIYADLAGQDEHAPGTIIPTDHLYTRGTQAWARNRSAA